MTDKEEILKELKRRYNNLKEENKIKTNLEDLERIFYVKDMFVKDGFVAERLSRRICHRISETFMDWNGYLHSIVMPNPQNMLNMMESKVFTQDEKKEMMEIMKKIMELGSRNSVLVLTNDKTEEAKFIDEATKFWDSEFRNQMTKIMKKINSEWAKK